MEKREDTQAYISSLQSEEKKLKEVIRGLERQHRNDERILKQKNLELSKLSEEHSKMERVLSRHNLHANSNEHEKALKDTIGKWTDWGDFHLLEDAGGRGVG